jgi:splicing factor 3B subunit 3
MALEHTPRCVATFPDYKLLAVVEGDANPSVWRAEGEGEGEGDGEAMDVDGEAEGVRVVPGGGVLRIMDAHGDTRVRVPLRPGELPLSVEFVRFRCASPSELFVVVGLVPAEEGPSATRGFIDVYRVVAGTLELSHRTEVDGPPRALRAFRAEQKLLAGVGAAVRIYDLGKNKLLKKCEAAGLRQGGGVVRLEDNGHRVFVADVLRGVQWLAFSPTDNTLRPLADDRVPRLITDACLMDQSTIVGADKLGNIFLLRMPWPPDEAGPLGE